MRASQFSKHRAARREQYQSSPTNEAKVGYQEQAQCMPGTQVGLGRVQPNRLQCSVSQTDNGFIVNGGLADLAGYKELIFVAKTVEEAFEHIRTVFEKQDRANQMLQAAPQQKVREYAGEANRVPSAPSRY